MSVLLFHTRLKIGFDICSVKAEEMVKDTCVYKYTVVENDWSANK